MSTISIKLYVAIVLLFCSTNFLCAQDSLFVSNKFDFGEISVAEKSVTHTFKFANETDHPVIIKSAYAHCSCIETTWSKEPIAVNDPGYVSIRYHILGTGTFNKKIRVSTNVGTHYLNVKGKAVRTK